MKRFAWCLILFCSLARLAAAESSEIVTTTYPLALFVRNITAGIQQLQVQPLVPAGHGCLHDFSLRPVDVVRLRRAALVLANGAGMEQGALQELIAALPARQRWTAAEAMSLTAPDPHFSADLRVVPPLLEKLTVYLSELWPQHAPLMRQNLQAYMRRLQPMFDEWRGLQALAKGIPVSATAETVVGLMESLQFSVYPVIFDSEFTQPTAQQVEQAPEKLRNLRVRILVGDAANPGKFGPELSRMVGAQWLLLDPLFEVEANQAARLDLYEATMLKNFAVVRQTLNRVRP